MSKTLSLSQTVTGLTRGQALKLLEMAEHGLLKSPVFKGVPTVQVDEFVKNVGPEMRDAFVELIEWRFQALIGYHRILVNYDEPDAISRAIDENGFDYKYVNVEPINIPLVGQGQVEQQVHEVHFGKVMYSRDLPAALKVRGVESGFPLGFKFADVLTALKFALKFPDKQRQYPLGILFYDKGGQLCYLCLNEYDGERYLLVGRGNPGGGWDESVRFLVVREV